jgi:hypothetical protein
MLMKGLADRKGMLSFDFTVSGHLNDFKAKVKFKVMEAITRSLRDKLGLNKLGKATVFGVKKVGKKITNAFKGIFKH